MLSLQLNDICYSPANDRLYGAVPGDRAEGNSIAVIHPLTGAVEQYIPVGSEPSVLRVSANGRYLYVGLHGSPFIQRYDLLSGTLGTPISLEEFFDPPYDNHYPIHAGDIQPLPGDGTSIAVSQRDLNTTPGFYGLSVFDNESERSLTTSSGVSGGDKIVVTEDGQTLWGLGTLTSLRLFAATKSRRKGSLPKTVTPTLLQAG
jgi:DNA-binding beta-propeller fold protein YncE